MIRFKKGNNISSCEFWDFKLILMIYRFQYINGIYFEASLQTTCLIDLHSASTYLNKDNTADPL